MSVFAVLGLLLVTTPAELLPRARLTPLTGVIVWLAVLCVRALTILIFALLLVSYLPATQLFERATGWCLHAVVPFLAAHIDFSGHRLGELAILLPSIALVLSLVAALFGLWRAGRRVRDRLSAATLGNGPRQSIVIGGPEVIVAAAGVRKARIVISTGALTALDDEELAAGLEHEQGHIERRHSYVSLLARLLFCVARPAPGSRHALQELQFHLERDADEYAVARTGNPLALATTIGKAARSPASNASPALATLSGADTPMRMRLLLDRGQAEPSSLLDGFAVLLGATLLLVAVGLAIVVPTIAQAGVGHAAEVALRCAQ